MKQKSEREKMLDGELYSATDAELTRMHFHAIKLIHQFNFTDISQVSQQQEI